MSSNKLRAGIAGALVAATMKLNAADVVTSSQKPDDNVITLAQFDDDGCEAVCPPNPELAKLPQRRINAAQIRFAMENRQPYDKIKFRDLVTTRNGHEMTLAELVAFEAANGMRGEIGLIVIGDLHLAEAVAHSARLWNIKNPDNMINSVISVKAGQQTPGLKDRLGNDIPCTGPQGVGSVVAFHDGVFVSSHTKGGALIKPTVLKSKDGADDIYRLSREDNAAVLGTVGLVRSVALKHKRGKRVGIISDKGEGNGTATASSDFPVFSYPGA